MSLQVVHAVTTAPSYVLTFGKIYMLKDFWNVVFWN